MLNCHCSSLRNCSIAGSTRDHDRTATPGWSASWVGSNDQEIALLFRLSGLFMGFPAAEALGFANRLSDPTKGLSQINLSNKVAQESHRLVAIGLEANWQQERETFDRQR